MTIVNDILTFNFDEIPIDTLWNFAKEKELKIHQIHAYPAKFPAFVTTKALEYSANNKIAINTIADIFCGCGTTAFEAKRNNINYWGCDINPVATLIARTKSRNYQISRLEKYFSTIISDYKTKNISDQFDTANERLKYWYSKDQYNALAYLKSLIGKHIPDYSNYRLFFLCAFSNILKAASRWLTKSIKPQIDPNKNPVDVYTLFTLQFKKMILAVEELPVAGNSKSEIVTGNVLDNSFKLQSADMIITSPPYVTSYEYADLHQLSTLWLGFVDNYKNLRKGTIGSLYHEYNFDGEYNKLNTIGKFIVSQLQSEYKSKARSIAKYFLDMQKIAEKTHSMLNNNGIAFFIIGNTEYKNIKIDNVRHLAESLKNSGYNEISVSKRKISQKILTPYRDRIGRFTTDSTGHKIYSEEFILIGRK